MRTHIWRYTENVRNYPGYHLSADAAGCDALLKWLAGADNRREYPLQKVTREVLSVPNNKGGRAAYVEFACFSLRVKPDVAPGHWILSEYPGRLDLECSWQQVEILARGIMDIKSGRGDYCMGEDAALWFWWYSG